MCKIIPSLLISCLFCLTAQAAEKITSYSPLEEIEMATQFIKDVTKTKFFKLHKGREVYVCVGKQLKNR